MNDELPFKNFFLEYDDKKWWLYKKDGGFWIGNAERRSLATKFICCPIINASTLEVYIPNDC